MSHQGKEKAEQVGRTQSITILLLLLLSDLEQVHYFSAPQIPHL